jgi:hypothetical protein
MFVNEGGQKHLVRDTKGQWGSKEKDGYSVMVGSLRVFSTKTLHAFISLLVRTCHQPCSSPAS